MVSLFFLNLVFLNLYTHQILYQTHQATENNLGNQLINTVTNAINSIIPSSPNQNTTSKSSEKPEKRKRIWSIAQVCDKPPNEESILFHKKYGFEQVDTQFTENGKKEVSLMKLSI